VSAIVVAGLAAGTVLWMRPMASPARVARFAIPTPAEPPIQFSLVPIPVIAISRDGSPLVYRMTDGESTATNGVLYQRGLGQVEATPMPGTEGANGFFFSPDGTWVGFSSGLDNTLNRVAVAGGPPQSICALDGLLRGASWGPDDTIVFATTASKGLRRVPAVGGHAQVLTTVDPTHGETDHFWPEMLPDGKGVIFTAWNGTVERSRIVALSFASGQVSEIVRGGSQPQLSPSGHLVYAVGGTLNAVRFNTARLAAMGDPAPLLEGVSFAPTGATQYALAGDGSLIYVKGGSYANNVPRRTLVWVDRQGREEAIKDVPPRAYAYARLSPDGTRVALDARDQQNDIWIWDLARGGLQRLTTDPGMNRSPVWTPDGMRVAFTAEREGVVESIYWQKADASGVPERLSIAQPPRGRNPSRQMARASSSRPHSLGLVISAS
jgi:serine/threonine-protein kinase